MLEGDLENTETKLTETKATAQDAENSKSSNDALSRKVQLLEEELDAAEKNSKDLTDKYASRSNICTYLIYHTDCCLFLLQAEAGRRQGRALPETVTQYRNGARCLGEQVRGMWLRISRRISSATSSS